MKVIEVNNKKLEKEFIDVGLYIYKDDKYWVRPLDIDIQNVFDKKKNKTFRHGNVKRWVLIKESECIGRIAAFYNNKTKNLDGKLSIGGCGFFECINNQKAANLLFETCKNWLRSNKIEGMDGPINFGERDKWWGCLVEGFDINPNYQQNFGKRYYKKLFETYGFKVLFKQFTFTKKITSPLSERLYYKAKVAMKNPNYNFKHLKLSQLEKYTNDFRKIYNEAWAKYPGVSKMSSLQAKSIMNQLKPIIDEKIAWFAYEKEEPVGFFLCIPEMNQIFKHVNGKFNLIAKIKIFYHLKILRSCKKMVGLVFGIVPAHQGKGLDGALIMATRKTIQEKLSYDILELNLIPDFNTNMIKVAEQVGVKIAKIHHTYRHHFNKSIPIERVKIR